MSTLDAFAARIAPVPPAKDAWVRGVIYGESGIGKTRLSITKKRGGKVLFANIEDGFTSVAGSGIDKIDLRKYEDFQNLYLFLKRGGHPYDLVWLDTFTEAKRFMTAEVMDDKFAARSTKNIFQPSQDDYRMANEKLRRWIWDMHGLPMHIIYVCLPMRVKREGEIVTRITLDCGESLANSLFAYCSFVGKLVVVEADRANKETGAIEKVEARKLWLKSGMEGGTRFDAKVRTPVGVTAPDGILQPTLDKLLSIWNPVGDKTEVK